MISALLTVGSFLKMSKFPIRDIVQQFLPQLIQDNALNGHQKSTLHLIGMCKTVALGGHRERCDQCHFTRIHYNSCGNRNCPSCQGINKDQWIHNRQHDLLPVPYFHCVFTVPSELHSYFRYNKKILYDLLLTTARLTLDAFGLDPKHGIGAKIGGINVLHTWTQQLAFHPHVHCIVPAGGITQTNTWKSSSKKPSFLFPVKAMSALFRGKFLAQLKILIHNDQIILPDDVRHEHQQTISELYLMDWVAYAKKAFGGPQQVLEYLARYTHKICISNHRIIQVTDSHVTFRYLDRKNKTSNIKTLQGIQFLKLFAEHILPKGFVKIRHFGFLASRVKKQHLKAIRKSLNVTINDPPQKRSPREFITFITGVDPYICPCCLEGEMVITAVIPATRGSPIRVYRRPFSSERTVKLG